MKEQLINFETAKLAKEKGFNEKCKFHHYSVAISRAQKRAFPFKESELLETYMRDRSNSELSNKRYSAPTQSLLQKWLREVHNIHVEIYSWYTGTFYAFNLFKGKDSTNLVDIDWSESNTYHKERGTSSVYSYEEALEKGLQSALKLIQ